MHSIIKNLSKVLALTTMVSSFAILPGAKASGTEPENIPQLQNGRSETQVPTAEMISTAIAELNRRLGGVITSSNVATNFSETVRWRTKFCRNSSHVLN